MEFLEEIIKTIGIFLRFDLSKIPMVLMSRKLYGRDLSNLWSGATATDGGLTAEELLGSVEKYHQIHKSQDGALPHLLITN